MKTFLRTGMKPGITSGYRKINQLTIWQKYASLKKLALV
jgi:hypothetical protein